MLPAMKEQQGAMSQRTQAESKETESPLEHPEGTGHFSLVKVILDS